MKKIVEPRLVNFSKIAVIDTNLLLLLVTGLVDKTQIGVAERLKQYSVNQFNVLHHLCLSFKQRTTTPHILAETSNLGRKIFHSRKQFEFAEQLSQLIGSTIKPWDEHHISLRETNLKVHGLFGLTDATLLHLSDEHLVISDDGPLTNFLHNNGKHTLRFIDVWEHID
ncbi:MAG: hypothetical protein QM533_06250 [Cytophagales bacterium]|nr:hypothetical protein [Cytophagales bacterium]